MNVPFVDLKVQYQSIKPEIDKAIADTIAETDFIMGRRVEAFEKEFAAFCGAKHCITTSNGTSAIYLALVGLGIGKGDEVIVPSHTFIGTAEPAVFCGAAVKFADIDEKTYTISPASITKLITKKTKAIIPVHLYGQMAAMDEIMAIAKAHNLFVIEDACQAHGALYKGKKAGALGHAGCFSFYPGKNLGCYGDGGAVVTNDDALAETMAMLRDHGRKKGEKYKHDAVGFNFRMDALQAAILSIKLKHLLQWTAARRKLARGYADALKNFKGIVQTPEELPQTEGVYHLYVIRTRKRDQLQAFLKQKGIQSGIHYPIPLHLQPAFSSLKHTKGEFPATEQAAEEVLSLPLFPEMTQEQQGAVVNAINEFFN